MILPRRMPSTSMPALVLYASQSSVRKGDHVGRLTCDLDAVIVLEEILEGRKSHSWLIRSRHAATNLCL